MAGETRQRMKCREVIVRNLLVILTLLGAGLGFAIGFGIRPYGLSDSALMWIGITGEMYLRILKMMIVPLVVASVISGTASLDPSSNGKISTVSLVYILTTNFLGALTGCILAVVFRPGTGIENENISDLKVVKMETQDIFADLLRNLLPDNLITAAFEQAQTKYELGNATNIVNSTTNVTLTIQDFTKSVGYARSTNILGLIIASTLFGIASSALRNDQAKPFQSFFTSATAVIIQILQWIIWSTPLGVCSLIAKTIASTKNIEEDFRKLGLYTGVVSLGLAFCALALVPIVYFIIKRANPFRFIGSIIQPILIVFATSSTVIAIPQSLKCLEGDNQVDSRITRFVVPLSATLGRCGSSVYISTSCVFVMQLVNMETDAGKIILVCILTTFSSLAVPSVTGASLVTVIILLTALGIPAESASLLFALEWLLDRLRSDTNIIVQSFGSVMTQRFCPLENKVEYSECKEDLEENREVPVTEANKETIHDAQCI